MSSILPLLAAFLCIKALSKSNLDISAKLLFICMLTMSLCQAIGLPIIPYSVNTAAFFADSYLITMYFFFASLVIFVYRLSNKKNGIFFLYLIPLILTVLHLSGLMVTGYRAEQSSLMHDDGKFSFLFELEALLAIVGSLTISILNRRFEDDQIVLAKNMIISYSFIPLAMVTVLLVILSATDYAISATYVSPPIIIYSALIYGYVSNPKVIDISTGISHLPARLKLAIDFIFISANKTELDNCFEQEEKQILMELYLKHKGNTELMANDYGVNQSYIDNKIDELDIVKTLSTVVKA